RLDYQRIGVCLVFPVAALVWSSRQGWSSEPGAGQGSPGMASANPIVGAALYCVGVGTASLLMGHSVGWACAAV
ncbi:MAG: hypothetical protein OEM76_16410, partial [Gammaproteobacteria bacterium]|nr:hypothetical protein [Gammaproteobacteria bacterium]